MRSKVNFRPHHFLCAFCYQGKGYSPAFIKNFDTLMGKLNFPEGDSTSITITPHTDDICQACPHQRGLACESQDKVAQLDSKHQAALGLQNIHNITWGEAKHCITTRLTIEKFKEICHSCEWQKFGICESVLRSSGVK